LVGSALLSKPELEFIVARGELDMKWLCLGAMVSYAVPASPSLFSSLKVARLLIASYFDAIAMSPAIW